MKRLNFMFLVLLCCEASAQIAAQPAAATAATATSTAGNFFQVLMGLIVVLGLMAGTAWLMKRLGMAKSAGNATVKIVGGVSVGNRERVMVIEVADLWIVVGVATGQVNALATIPRPEGAAATEVVPVTKNFSAWLKQTIDKRNGNDPLNQ